MFIIQYPTLVFGLVTYYTDGSDADEDLTAIPAYGGYWPHADSAGITLRDMQHTSTVTTHVAASGKK